MKNKQHPSISKKEVQAAVARFLADGGIIRKLPDEPDFPRNLVGWRHGAYVDLNPLNIIFRFSGTRLGER